MSERFLNIGRNFISGFDIRKPNTLSEGVPFSQLSYYENFLAHVRLAQSVAVDFFDRYSDIVKNKVEKSSDFAGKIASLYESVTFFAQIEIASHWANSVKKDIGEIDGEVGKQRRAWHENSDHPHGRKHERIMRKGIKWLALQLSHEFKTDSDPFHRNKYENMERIDQMKQLAAHVLLRFGETHDEGQLHVEIYNDSIPDKQNHLRPKDLHELFGGLLATLDENKYSQLGRYTRDETRLITNMLLYTIVGHGEPMTYLDKENKQTEKAYSETENGPTEIEDSILFDFIKKGILDWSSISRSQFIKIVEHSVELGRDNGSFKGFDTSSGLHPMLHTFFTENGGIEALGNDHEPIFYKITEDEKKFLMLLRKMQLTVDLSEMVVPPIEAWARKVIVKKSENRKEFVALNPEGAPFNPETYISELLKTSGHDCVSDYERTVFELFEYLQIVKSCGLLEDPSTKGVFTDLLMDAFCGANWIFEQNMNPNTLEVEKNIRTIFNVQIYELISKALKRNNNEHLFVWSDVSSRGEQEASCDDLLERFSASVSDSDRATFSARASALSGLQDKTMVAVMNKWAKLAHDKSEQDAFVDLSLELMDAYAFELQIPLGDLTLRATEWKNGSLLENARRSKLPWVSTGVFMGKPEHAKLL